MKNISVIKKIYIVFFLLCTTILGQNGTVFQRSFMHQQNLRIYYLYVPADYDGTEKWPLIINYHGYTADPADQMDRTQMNVLADTANFIVAYPQGMEIQIPSGILPNFIPLSGKGWCVPGFSGQYDDVSFTDSLINDIMKDYLIDEFRIHTTGISLGAFMAFWAASHLPSCIASVAGVAGHMTDQLMANITWEMPISALFMLGTDDPVVLFNGLNNSYPSILNAVYYWSNQNDCPRDSNVTEIPDINTSDNTTVTLIKYPSCNDSTEVLFYRINGGGHRWPGSGKTDHLDLLGNNNMDINASAEIINFFKNNPRLNSTTSAEGVKSYASILEYKLLQNYPNPFNPTTTIEYSIPQEQFVTIKIFDALGREVAALVNEQKPVGTYQVNFDAASLASGIYFYQLQAGVFHQTKKLIVLK